MERVNQSIYRPEGNSLEDNYELHDVGEQRFLDTVFKAPSPVERVEPWGIDMRHDDKDGVIYDDAMDFKLFDDMNRLVGLADVKTKSSARWMGRFNARHARHYTEHAEEYHVPTYVFMYHTDRQENFYDGFVCDMKELDPLYSDESDGVRKFPDGNNAVLIPHSHRLPLGQFAADILYKCRY